jgi:hypothetical protein
MRGTPGTSRSGVRPPWSGSAQRGRDSSMHCGCQLHWLAACRCVCRGWVVCGSSRTASRGQGLCGTSCCITTPTTRPPWLALPCFLAVGRARWCRGHRGGGRHATAAAGCVWVGWRGPVGHAWGSAACVLRWPADDTRVAHRRAARPCKQLVRDVCVRACVRACVGACVRACHVCRASALVVMVVVVAVAVAELTRQGMACGQTPVRTIRLCPPCRHRHPRAGW